MSELSEEPNKKSRRPNSTYFTPNGGSLPPPPERNDSLKGNQGPPPVPERRISKKLSSSSLTSISSQNSPSTTSPPSSPPGSPPPRRESKAKKSVSVKDLQSATFQGELYCFQSSFFKSWNKRYCVLQDSVLYIYKKETDSDANDKIVLPGFLVSRTMSNGKKYCIKVSSLNIPSPFYLDDDHFSSRSFLNKLENQGNKNILLAAESEDKQKAWLAHLRVAAGFEDDSNQ